MGQEEPYLHTLELARHYHARRPPSRTHLDHVASRGAWRYLHLHYVLRFRGDGRWWRRARTSRSGSPPWTTVSRDERWLPVRGLARVAPGTRIMIDRVEGAERSEKGVRWCEAIFSLRRRD